MSQTEQRSWWNIGVMVVIVAVFTALISSAIQRLLFGKTSVAVTSAVVTVAVGAIGIAVRQRRRPQRP